MSGVAHRRQGSGRRAPDVHRVSASSSLDAEPSAQRNDPARKRARYRAEVRVADVVRNFIGIEVQIVKHVVGVNSKLNSAAFAEHSIVRQAKALCQRQTRERG